MNMENVALICNQKHEIGQINYNSYLQSHDQRKMLHRSTSTQAKWNFSFYPFTSDETSSCRPSIEYVKLFLNRFLTDLAKERCDLVSFKDQSNTNFVQLKNKWFGRTFESNVENNSQKQTPKQNINSEKAYNLNEDIENFNPIDSCGNFDNNQLNLVEGYSKKLFSILLIMKVRSLVKRIIRKKLKAHMPSKKKDCLFENPSRINELSSLVNHHYSNEAEIIFYEDCQKSNLVDINISTVKVDYNPSFNNLEAEESVHQCKRGVLDSYSNTSLKPPLSEKVIKIKPSKILKRLHKSNCKIHKSNQCESHLDIKPASVPNKATLFYKLFTSVHKNRSNNIVEKSANRNISIVGKKYCNSLRPYKEKNSMKNRPRKIISKLDQSITEYKLHPIDDTEQFEGKSEIVVEISC